MKLSILGALGMAHVELANALAVELRARSYSVLLTFNGNSAHAASALESSDFYLAVGLTQPVRPDYFDLTLLMGHSANTFDSNKASQNALQLADAQLRLALNKNAVEFQVIYGSGAQQLANALRAIDALVAKKKKVVHAALIAPPAKPWVWPCDKCSDPQCERQLFRRLLG